MQGPSKYVCEGGICISSIGCNRPLRNGQLIFERRAHQWALNVVFPLKRESEMQIQLSSRTIQKLPPNFESICETGDINIPFSDGKMLILRSGRLVFGGGGSNSCPGLSAIGRLLLAIKHGDGVGLLGGGGGDGSTFGVQVHEMEMFPTNSGETTPPRPIGGGRLASGGGSAPPIQRHPVHQFSSGGSRTKLDQGERLERNGFKRSYNNYDSGSSYDSGNGRYTGTNGYSGKGGQQQQQHYNPRRHSNSFNNNYGGAPYHQRGYREGGGGNGNQRYGNHHGNNGGGGGGGGGGGYNGNRHNGAERSRPRGRNNRNSRGRFNGGHNRGGGGPPSSPVAAQRSSLDRSYHHHQSSHPLKDRGSAENSLDRSGSDRGNDNDVGESPIRKLNIASDDENVRPKRDGYSPSPRRPSSSRTSAESTPFGDSGSGLSKSRFYGKSTPKQLYQMPSPISSSSKSNYQYKRMPQQPNQAQTPSKKAKIDSEDERDKENRVSLNSTYTRSRPAKLSGFKNLGNTCYMNAILQSLYCLDYFSRDLLTIYHHVEHLLPKKSLYRSICELLKENVRPNSQHANNFFESLLVNLKNSVEQLFRSFAGHNMQDAHEFVTRMLDHVKDEVDHFSSSLSETEPLPTEVDDKFENPVKRHFEFETIENYQCTECSNVVSKKQVAYDLGVFVPKARKQGSIRSLQLVLDNSFKTEKREFRCEKCEHNESMVEVRISRLPRIMSVHLKRYMMTGPHIIKNDAPLIIPKYVTMRDYTSEDVSSNLSDNVVSVSSASNSTLSEFNASMESLSEVSPDSRTDDCAGFSLNFNATIQMAPLLSSNDLDGFGESELRGEESKEPVIGLCGGQGPVVVPEQEEPAADQSSPAKEVSPVALSAEETFGPLNNIDENPPTEEEMACWSKYDPGNAIEDVVKEEDEDEDLRKAKMLSLQDLEQAGDPQTVPEEDEEEPDEMAQMEDSQAVKENFETGNLPNSYHLVSVVLHMGNIEKGHYTCNTYDFRKNVYRKFDDSEVTEISEEDFFTDARTHGYVLMYIRKDQWSSTSPSSLIQDLVADIQQ